MDKAKQMVQGFIELRKRNYDPKTDGKLKDKLVKELGVDTIREVCQDDPKLFVEAFLTIINKQAKRVPFILNESQIGLYDHIKEKGFRGTVSTPKSRQMGMSVIISALSVAKFVCEDDVLSGVVSLDLKTSQKLFTSRYLQMMKDVPKALMMGGKAIEYSNKTEATTYDGNMISCVGASDNSFRGQALNGILHLSESAFYECGQQAVFDSLEATLSDSCLVIIESTSNGKTNNDYYDFTKALLKGEFDKRYSIFFIDWYKDSTYSLDMEYASVGFKTLLVEGYKKGLSKEEKYILEVIPKLTEMFGNEEALRKANWYYSKYKALKYKVFGEYPPSILDSFITLEGTFIDLDVLEELDKTVRKPLETFKFGSFECNFYRRRVTKEAYTLGIDVASGRGRDYTVITVVDSNANVVATMKSNTSDLRENARMILNTYNKFNHPMVVIESNSMGTSLIDVMGTKIGRRLWRDKTKIGNVKSGDNSYGFATTQSSKAKLLINLKEELSQIPEIADKGLAVALRETKANPDITSQTQTLGHTSDEVMAYALAVLGIADSVKFKAGISAPILKAKKQSKQVFEWDKKGKLVPSTIPNKGVFQYGI